MFENLTRFLSELKSCDSFGEWRGFGSHGTSKNQIPFVRYSKLPLDVIKEIYAIVEANPDMELKDYEWVLKQKGIPMSGDSFKDTDVSKLDGQAVMAMLVCIVRTDRFIEGLLLEYLENGKFAEWIGRLKELDEEL
ncbi:MAG: hypothetical protein J5803_00275 [Desulfovibrio sp.]|nr:hypothetical protein [Desulfovibrio sp.]